MSYLVLARKWRPHNFSEMVGQEHVVRALSNALDNDRLHHAYLFTGTRGVGKTTLARILSKSLNCEQGVSSTPCGTCSVCQEIDEGRFADLLEIDAASKTGVDDTRELLENVPYAPVRGRYKVYLIDEVHMFSNHSFNALLKTLEEPPPHVKFLLATTDPQKVPVTVLSRCLQFSLKRLSIEQIQQQLETILKAEQVDYEAPALFQIALAADGSMRDGLSLLDQAIAFGGGVVNEAEVKAMLGVMAVDQMPDLLQAVHTNEPGRLMALIDQIAEQSPDFSNLLKDLLTLLHRIALIQMLPEAVEPSWGEPKRIQQLAGIMAPEDAQLYYQIALTGQKDLPLAPDPRSGFEMILLRMIAFRPDASSQGSARPTTAKASRQAPAAQKAVPVETATPARSEAGVQKEAGDLKDWHLVLPQLGLRGMSGQLASHCTLKNWDGQRLQLVVDPAHASLLGTKAEENLLAGLNRFAQTEIQLEIRIAASEEETPAQRDAGQKADRQQSALETMRADPVVKAIQDRFDAELIEESVLPIG